eukprot:7984864-Alexandrium_andersonii.AAC.1
MWRSARFRLCCAACGEARSQVITHRRPLTRWGVSPHPGHSRWGVRQKSPHACCFHGGFAGVDGECREISAELHTGEVPTE